jgi:predicted nucleic acid-binding protein
MNTMDADVCIDLLRRRPEALTWFDALDEPPSVSGFVAMELLAGCQSRIEWREVESFLDDLNIVWASEQAANEAMTIFLLFRLSHGIGVLDCLIAATAKEQGGTLYTFNRRHFRPLPDVIVAEPYIRIQS